MWININVILYLLKKKKNNNTYKYQYKYNQDSVCVISKFDIIWNEELSLPTKRQDV